MANIAFYIMNAKGWYALSHFIDKFGSKNISYVVCGRDSQLKNDSFDEIMQVGYDNNLPMYTRKSFDVTIEYSFGGYKFAIGWRWLIKNQKNLIVFHDSLLPKYRGFAPLVNSLINKEKYGGVTALFADSGYDEGNIISQKSTLFQYPIKIEEAIRQIQPLYFELVDEIYTSLEQGKTLLSQPQRHDEATYSPWLDNQDYFINWSWNAEKVKRFVDAVSYPYDGAKAKLNDQVIKIESAKVIDDVSVEHRDRHIGKVIFFENNSPVIICKQGLIKLQQVLDIEDNPLCIPFRSRFY